MLKIHFRVKSDIGSMYDCLLKCRALVRRGKETGPKLQTHQAELNSKLSFSDGWRNRKLIWEY